MSKISRRPNRERIKAERKQYKKAQKVLREDENAKGLQKGSHGTISNCKCRFENVDEEKYVRNQAVAEQIKISSFAPHSG